MVIRQRNLPPTNAKYVFGKEKRKSPGSAGPAVKTQKTVAAVDVNVADPVSRAVSPSLRPPPSELEARCLEMDAMVKELPITNDKTVRKVINKAQDFIGKKEEEGDESVTAPVIFLGNIPELANMPREMTTAQVGDYIKQKFKGMRPAQFDRGWYGVEAYFKQHFKGAATHGYVPKKGWINIDHVIAQYFGMFHHPRFYALMPPAINIFLRDNPPITRMGFGITRHEIVLMHNWMKHIEKTARKQNIQNLLLGSLVQAMPVMTLE